MEVELLGLGERVSNMKVQAGMNYKFIRKLSSFSVNLIEITALYPYDLIADLYDIENLLWTDTGVSSLFSVNPKMSAIK